MTVDELRTEFPQVGYASNIYALHKRGLIRRRMGQIKTKTHMVRAWRYNTSDVVKVLNNGRVIR